MIKKTTVFDVFEKCVRAVQDGELIESISAKDKEFHFQNWFQKRLQSLSLYFEGVGRNTYPDFGAEVDQVLDLTPASQDFELLRWCSIVESLWVRFPATCGVNYRG